MLTCKRTRAALVRGLLSLTLAGSMIVPGVMAYADEVPADQQETAAEAADQAASSDTVAVSSNDGAQDTGAEAAQDDSADATTEAQEPAAGAAGSEETAADAAAGPATDAKEAAAADEDAVLTEQAVTYANLSAGAYEIRTSYCVKVLDITSGKYAVDGALVQTYDANGTVAQRWYLRKSGKHYVIGNGVSGLVLDMGGAGVAKDTQLRMAAYTGSDAQLWDIIEIAGGESYEIVSVANGMALDVKSKSTANGAKVQIHNANHSAAQRWKLTKLDASVSDGAYVIKSFAGESYVFDVKSGSKASGAVVRAHRANGSLAQTWKLTFDSKVGAYRIRSANSGKLLGLPGSKTTLGLQVQQLDAATNASQLWSIAKNADGSYSITSVYGGRTLGLEGATLVNDAAVVLQKKTGDATQKWTLGEATLLSSGLYLMGSSLDTSKIIDIKSASTAEVAAAQLWSKNNTLAQKWVVVEQSDGSFTFMNANSGRYLADSGGTLVHAEIAGSVASWKVRVSDAGGIALVNASTGRALDVKGGKKAAGTVVDVHRSNGTAAQAWYFTKTTPIVDGDYIFTNVGKSSLAMDVKGGSTADKAIIQLHKDNGSNAQKWNVKKGSDGYYTITNLKSGMVLDVTGGKAQAGNGIQQHNANNTAAQKWSIEVSPFGGLSITSAKANVVLGVAGGTAKADTALALAIPGGDPSSSWRFKKTTKAEEATVVVDPAKDSAAYVAPSGVTVSAAYQKQMVARANAAKTASFTSKAWSYLNDSEKQLVKQRGSATNWYITVEKGGSSGFGTKVCVLHYNNGAWQVVRNFRANTGSTFSGRFVIIHKQQSYWLPGISYYGAKYTQSQLMNINPYWMCYVHDEGAYGGNVESGQGFHGGTSSKGCIVMPDGTASTGGPFGEAEWLYNNVPVHTTVDLF